MILFCSRVRRRGILQTWSGGDGPTLNPSVAVYMCYWGGIGVWAQSLHFVGWSYAAIYLPTRCPISDVSWFRYVSELYTPSVPQLQSPHKRKLCVPTDLLRKGACTYQAEPPHSPTHNTSHYTPHNANNNRINPPAFSPLRTPYIKHQQTNDSSTGRYLTFCNPYRAIFYQKRRSIEARMVLRWQLIWSLP
jgi:hypothetical protein